MDHRLEELYLATKQANETGDSTLVPVLRKLNESTGAVEDPDDAGLGAETRGGALLLAFKLGFDQADLTQAIDQLEAAVARHPTSRRRGNLASALLERSGITGSPDDHHRAIGLLDAAIADRQSSPAAVLLRRTTRLGALVDGVERELLDINPLEVVAIGEELLDRATEGGTDVGEIANLTGSAYHLASQRQVLSTSTLDRMVELSEIAITALPAGHPDRPARLSNLSTAYLQRYNLLGDPAALRSAETAMHTAFEELKPGHPSRPLALNNLLNVAVAAYEATGRATHLGQLLAEALALPECFPLDHPLRAVAESNLGLFLRAAAAALARPDLLDIAVDVQRLAVSRTSADSSQLAGRTAGLSLALADLYNRDHAPALLTEAIDHGERALAMTERGHEIDIIGFETNLANLYHDRFNRDGAIVDLQTSRDLHREGTNRIPDRHPDRATLLNNAGIAEHGYYLRIGDPNDLVHAIDLLGDAIAVSSKDSIYLASRRVNYASALHSAIAHSDHEQIRRLLTEAERQIELALAGALSDTDRDIATGIYVSILRAKFVEFDDQSALDAIQHLDPVDQLADRPAASLRRGISAGLARDRELEERHLLRALRQGVSSRPAIAVNAAALLSDHGLRRSAAGDMGPGLNLVTEAATTAFAVRDAVQLAGQTPTSEVSWYRDLDGIGEALAHCHLHANNAPAALTAVESNRASFLGRMLPDETDGHPCLVYLWSTPVGVGILGISRNGALRSEIVTGLTTDDLTVHAAAISNAARNGQTPIGQVDAALEQLDTHLGPALKTIIGDHHHICISATGPLASLPLPAIAIDDTPIAQRHLVTFGLTRATAAWAAGHDQELVAPNSIVSFADPSPSPGHQLPAAVAESTYLASEQNRRHGFDATPTAFMNAISDTGTVHAALHASTAAYDPLSSRLHLAGGPLHVQTLLNKAPYSARLVILSACETSMPASNAADQSLAIASTLHAGGIPGVLGSLWSVGDVHSAELVCAFVDRLKRGEAPALALQNTQADLRQRGIHPARWAAYQLLGS